MISHASGTLLHARHIHLPAIANGNVRDDELSWETEEISCVIVLGELPRAGKARGYSRTSSRHQDPSQSDIYGFPIKMRVRQG